jgi:DNA-binding Lrp family transcriptional regulator
MQELDSKDRQILALLRENARIAVVDIASKLGLSRATVQSHINRLERDGIILGYTVRLRADIAAAPVRAQTCISVESKLEAKVIASLRGNPHITAIHHTTGRWDLIAELQAESLPAFNAIVGELRLINGVVNTETSLLLDTCY